MRHRIVRYRVPAVLLLALYVNACGRLAAPPQLTPVGDLAYHANRVIAGVKTPQQIVIDGEAAKAISTNDARVIIKATEVAGTAGVDLAGALKAEAGGTDARSKAVRTIRQAFTEIQNDLSPETQQTVQPYITVILSALALFE